MKKIHITAVLRCAMSLLLSAVIAFSSAQLFSVKASAESSMLCKVTYSNKYTYLTVTPSKSGNVVRYTVDGSAPDEDSKLYKSRLRASAAATVRLVEYDKNGEEVDRKKLTLKRKCCKPEIQTEITEEGVKVSLSSDSKDAVIYYSTNGKKPTTKSKVYTEPFIVEEGTTIRAFAAKTDWLTSYYLKTKVESEDSVKVETASGESSVMSEAEKITDSEVILKLLEETNKYRAENGLPELKLDADLCKAARIRADELLASDYSCVHSRLDGRKWYTVLSEIGYRYKYGAENLAYTKDDLNTANTVIQMWIDSEVHRMNMLNNYGDSIGLAYTKNGNKVYWVQIYGQEK
ncbi:MAG: chitobiase/beta-hexosaminidase C-terminal domain-containing protein [Ruminiclostridium sp.]|nr:chitobiase/beta-hexosaminidase C-terminal domain-containing protein [Ruminiclostridium sp.]